MSFDVAERFAVVTAGASAIDHASADMLAVDSEKHAEREVRPFLHCIDPSKRRRRSPSGGRDRVGPAAGS